MRKLRFVLAMFVVVFLVAASDYGEAATPVTIALTGPSTYTVTVTDLPESSGIELSILYDTDTLESPHVQYGGLVASAFSKQANVSTAGVVRIYIFASDAIKGTGMLASILFTKKTGTQAKLKGFTADVYSLAYSRIPINPIIDGNAAASGPTSPLAQDNPVNVVNPSGNTIGTATQSYTGNTATNTTANSTPGYTGSISLSDPSQQSEQKKESKIQENRSDSQSGSSQLDSPILSAEAKEATPAATAHDSNNKDESRASRLHTFKGVLVRFREYRGQRTLKSLTDLFDAHESKTAGVFQRPAIVVSDGKSLVTVSVELQHESDAPVFSLKGANQKTIKRISKKKWELQVLPQKGKYDVRLSVLLQGERIEFPLVVVPVLHLREAVMADLSAAELDALLAKPLKNNKPTYDVNSDGKQDYLDDYFLVANWLLKHQPGVERDGRRPAVVGN